MTTTSKVWFITGASSGFGRAFAEYALRQGYCVVIGARRTEKLEEIVQLAPERVLSVSMDVNHSEQVKSAIQAALERFGHVDVLFNNAGYGIVGAIEETTEEELRAQMETNFFGAIAVTRALLPTFRSQRGGAIVNISSLGGQASFAGFGAYSASKFALEGASEALAAEMKPFGVKVLIAEPGAFRTEFAGSALKRMPEMEEYKDTVGQTRRFAKGMDATQEGDPYKAAQAIEQALKAPETPLRLQIGQDSVQAIRAHAENLLSDLRKWESVALDTKLDGR